MSSLNHQEIAKKSLHLSNIGVSLHSLPPGGTPGKIQVSQLIFSGKSIPGFAPAAVTPDPASAPGAGMPSDLPRG
jgi:hypothetical protein